MSEQARPARIAVWGVCLAIVALMFGGALTAVQVTSHDDLQARQHSQIACLQQYVNQQYARSQKVSATFKAKDDALDNAFLEALGGQRVSAAEKAALVQALGAYRQAEADNPPTPPQQIEC